VLSNRRKSREGDGAERAGMRRPVTAALIAAGFGIALLGLVGGYQVAHRSGEADAENRRAALRSALGDFRALFGYGNEVDPRFVRMVERSIGLEDLKFEREPPSDARDMQPVLNAEGRIIGFFTWWPKNTELDSVAWLVPLASGTALGLIGFGALIGWHLRRESRARRESPPNPSHNPSGTFDVAAAASQSEEEQFIRRELHGALSARSLDVHYQPIVAAAGGRIAGIEALLRWTHPERGAISPAAFVPVAEKMGAMDELGAFVLNRALEDAKAWPDIYISVNLSPLQVRDRRIVDVVRTALRDSGVAPSRLVLEITEGVLIDNPQEMLKRIEELRALGVRIALDDFGSGYSSLGYLQRFAFDKLKIDRSFVSALGHSSNAAVIIQAIVALGRALDVTVVVEGVETEEQRVLLRLAGCDEMQGFLFARPAPAAAIAPLIAPSAAA
jgi:EAL domain-containing protein (putative c-di-GMP-specific phosphodiesterase class I)